MRELPEIRDVPWSVLCVNGINCTGKKETISFLNYLLQGHPSWFAFSPLIPPHSRLTEIDVQNVNLIIPLPCLKSTEQLCATF